MNDVRYVKDGVARAVRTTRGASTTDVMRAGNWKTSRMVAHYSAEATAERGAVAALSVKGLRLPSDSAQHPDRWYHFTECIPRRSTSPT